VRAQKAWAQATAYERAGVLRRWFELILAHEEPLARLMALEMGKPLKEGRGGGALRRGLRGVVRRGGRHLQAALLHPSLGGPFSIGNREGSSMGWGGPS